MSDLPDIIIKCNVHQWVKCTDRVPFPAGYERTWLVYDDGSFHVAMYLGEDNKSKDGLTWFNSDVYVNPTHWMPLPFPPEDK